MATMEQVVSKAAEAVGTYGRMRALPHQVDDLALATLSAAAADQQLDLFARWCYQKHDGFFVHILSNGQIPSGCWTPWSDKSHMSKPDRRILRAWMIGLAQRKHFPPWLYRAQSRRWYVDLTRYSSEQDALQWLHKHRVNPQDWLTLQLSLRKSAGVHR